MPKSACHYYYRTQGDTRAHERKKNIGAKFANSKNGSMKYYKNGNEGRNNECGKRSIMAGISVGKTR